MQTNQTEITEFILLGFGELQNLQLFLFFLFLLLYTSTMAANGLTLLLIVVDQHLHTPMYFFLGNLSCLEMFYSSAIQPKVLACLLTGDKAISFTGCITQLYFVGFFVGTECYLLSIMSYECYVAICQPFQYATRISTQMCVQLAAFSWISGHTVSLVLLSVMLQLMYCGPNEMDHYFCDSIPLMELSCNDNSLVKLLIFIMAIIATLPPFLLTLTSYIYIMNTVLQIPSATGRKKAFSTCSSHLIVVSTFYGALMIVYMFPDTEALGNLKKVFSLLYTVLTPMANPLIYSLRNKDVKESIRKILRRLLISRRSERGSFKLGSEMGTRE